ncbi:MAG: hypothetical protein JRH01_11185 [Deltaproteobacteria bacterium]|nr:hypothetical protein [Deltaproteobacteria bacterium]MBW2394549.1 hypothetical protein [Deltaproteobacteria bacterium]
MFVPNDETIQGRAEAPAVEPVDAAVQTWDPALWALYLTELAQRHRKARMN